MAPGVTGPSLVVVVLSCGDLGAEVAERLNTVHGVSRVCLVTAPYRQPHRTLAGKIRHVWRTQGPIGFARILGSRFGSRGATGDASERRLDPSIPQLHVVDFHAPEAIAEIAALGADLGVLAGTYILRESVFSLPRLGSINIHSGKAPQYRGAAPGFWELYNGEHEVGITIHRVTATLDAGHILRQETFPLDPAPVEDPMDYLERYRREVLRPEGVRLVAETVASLAAGTAVERRQDPTGARTYRSPDRTAVRMLRRRVAARRRAPRP
jgi:folate-dependent phosphoribosylglycinamide formyltransferase PurN